MDHAGLAPWIRVPSTWEDIPGYFDFDAPYRRVVAEAPPGSTLVEVGNLAGRSLCLLGSLARDAACDLRVVGVDHGRGSDSPGDGAGTGLAAALGGNFAGLLARNVAACGLADTVSLVVADSVRAAGLFAPASLHFVFLDGCHREQDVYRELVAWRPLIRPGGRIAGHDYRHEAYPGVAAAVRRFFGAGEYGDPDSDTCWSVRVG